MTIDLNLGPVAMVAGSFIAGWFANVWSVSRDERVVPLQEDEIIVKKPMDGLVLIQVAPDVARKVMQKYGQIDGSKFEARTLYDRYDRASRQVFDAERKEKTNRELD